MTSAPVRQLLSVSTWRTLHQLPADAHRTPRAPNVRQVRGPGREALAALDALQAAPEIGGAPEIASGGALEVELGGAPEIEPGGALEIESRGGPEIEPRGDFDRGPPLASGLVGGGGLEVLGRARLGGGLGGEDDLRGVGVRGFLDYEETPVS